MHRTEVPDHIKSMNIVRHFPDGKSYQCCLSNSVIASFANFKRHFQDLHKGISLNISAKCILCDCLSSHCRDAGVHLQCTHKIGKDTVSSLSHTPVMSYVDLEYPMNNSTSVPL